MKGNARVTSFEIVLTVFMDSKNVKNVCIILEVCYFMGSWLSHWQGSINQEVQYLPTLPF